MTIVWRLGAYTFCVAGARWFWSVTGLLASSDDNATLLRVIAIGLGWPRKEETRSWKRFAYWPRLAL